VRRRLLSALGLAGIASLLGGCYRFAYRGDDAPAVTCRPAAPAEYDYIVVNSELAQAVGDVAAILRAERHRRARLSGLAEFIGQRRLD